MKQANNVNDPNTEDSITPLLRQAFRPFFLGASVFSVVAILAWAAILTGQLSVTPYGGPFFWHAHEMLFGFVSAVVTGFLLTAVQNWTGLRATNSTPLALLFTLWLVGRFLMAFGSQLNPWIVMAVDVSFLPAVAVLMGQLVVRAGNRRNLFFVPVLGLLAMANLLTHLSVTMNNPQLFSWGVYAAVMLIALLMSVIGGRVIPMFTANGTGTERVPALPWLEKATLGLTWLLALLFISNVTTLLSSQIMAALFAVTALCHASRAARWRPWQTLGAPLVWSLHLAYWYIPVSLGLYAAHFWGMNVSLTTALHGLTAGAMGSLILSMITRVSLGHSGRSLVIPTSMAVGFVLVFLAGISRLLLGFDLEILRSHGYWMSAGCWALAFGLYIAHFLKILTTPRPDGRPG